MNTYKIQLKARDSHGIGFIEQVVRFANMGATIDTAFPTKNTFPNQIMLHLETEEFLEDDMAKGVQVHPVELQYGREYLETLTIQELRPLVKERGVTGRDCNQMIREYLLTFEKEEV